MMPSPGPAAAAPPEMGAGVPLFAASDASRRPSMAGTSFPPPRKPAMPVDAELRLLEIDIPAQPEALVKLSLLLAEEDVDLKALASLIESDMALAAAVLKAVNSSLYGLSGRVQAQQAITYLGTREVAAVTFEMGLRAVFPHAPGTRADLGPRRPARRADGRIAAALGVDPGSHSAGLFEGVRQGGSVPSLEHALQAAARPGRRRRGRADAARKHAEFGVSHDKLGAALCESWGPAAAVASVRHHVEVQATRELPQRAAPRGCALGARPRADDGPESVEEVAKLVAPGLFSDEQCLSCTVRARSRSNSWRLPPAAERSTAPRLPRAQERRAARLRHARSRHPPGTAASPPPRLRRRRPSSLEPRTPPCAAATIKLCRCRSRVGAGGRSTAT